MLNINDKVHITWNRGKNIFDGVICGEYKDFYLVLSCNGYRGTFLKKDIDIGFVLINKI